MSRELPATTTLVVGTGLIGTSIALALTSLGARVYLDDPSPTTLALAVDMGAGAAWTAQEADPDLVVIAAPPDVAAGRVVQALTEFPHAIVTDVASVKRNLMARVDASGADTSRFVGSHPMAGRARSGAAFADKDLFFGSPWVIAPSTHSTPEAVAQVKLLASDLGAHPVIMAGDEHDEAVAFISHVPQLVSSLLAARLVDAPDSALALAGQGLRDTTRIAASDPQLWTAIIAANAGPISRILRQFAADAGATADSLQNLADGEPAGAVGTISSVVAAGNRGVARIPGKHGQAHRRWTEIEVLVPDRPGALGSLFNDLGAAAVNVEDLTLEHSSGKRFGLARLMVDPGSADTAVEALESCQWRIISRGDGLA